MIPSDTRYRAHALIDAVENDDAAQARRVIWEIGTPFLFCGVLLGGAAVHLVKTPASQIIPNLVSTAGWSIAWAVGLIAGVIVLIIAWHLAKALWPIILGLGAAAGAQFLAGPPWGLVALGAATVGFIGFEYWKERRNPPTPSDGADQAAHKLHTIGDRDRQKR